MKRRPTKIPGSDNAISGAGFTLVELAMVLIISGLITALLLEPLRYEMKNQPRIQTVAAMTSIQAAMNEFMQVNHRYPCPAAPNLGPGNPLFGKEDCKLTPIPAAQGANGQAVDAVYIGAVPFARMQPFLTTASLSMPNTLDGWGRKIVYAVTKSLTKAETFNDMHGAIDIVDEYDRSVVTPPQSAPLVLISYGEDGQGGYDREGRLAAPCAARDDGHSSFSALSGIVDNCSNLSSTENSTTSCVGSNIVNSVSIGRNGKHELPILNEAENCDGANAKFLDGLRHETRRFYNDDIVKFMYVQSGERWKITGTVPKSCPPDGPACIYQATNINSGNVGLGVTAPTATLDVGTSIATNGNMWAKNLCNQDSGNCMPPVTLGGADPDMDCTNMAGAAINPGRGMAIIGIEDNHVICAPVFTTPYIFSCPEGSFIAGISNLGHVKCMTP